MDDETTGNQPDETELTRVTPPAGDDATRVMPPAGEGETQVMPGQDTGATQVMPAAGGAPPPPPPTQPTLLMSHSRSSGSGGVPWWVWLIVALVVIGAAAAVWFLYLRPTDTSTAGEQFIGNWAPEAGTGGGLVISAGRRRPVQDHPVRRPAPGGRLYHRRPGRRPARDQRSGLGARRDRRHRQGAGDADLRERERPPHAPVHVGRPPARAGHLRARGGPVAGQPHAHPEPFDLSLADDVAFSVGQPEPQPLGIADHRSAGDRRHRQAAGGHRHVGERQQQPLSAAAGRRRGRRHLAVRRARGRPTRSPASP